MTDSPPGALAQVTALDEERRRYEAWIAQLEARRGSVPEHVLARVRTDYEGRLRDVVARLAEHAELLRTEVADRAREVAMLRDAERERQDERAEAELRASVGEYAPEQWEQIARRTDAELRELAERRSAAEADLGRLEQVLALATSASPAAAAEPSGLDIGVVPVGAAADEPGWGERERRGAEDRGATRTPAAGVAAHAPAADGWAPPAAPAPPVASAPAVGATGRATPTSVPGVGDSGPQAKTLRCAECGTMNYPTEWYCERCGGELAAM